MDHLILRRFLIEYIERIRGTAHYDLLEQMFNFDARYGVVNLEGYVVSKNFISIILKLIILLNLKDVMRNPAIDGRDRARWGQAMDAMILAPILNRTIIVVSYDPQSKGELYQIFRPDYTLDGVKD